MSRLVIFTDLDGTLVETGTYDAAAARPVLEELRRRGVWVIPVTSRARREVEMLREQLGLEGPYIVENGSAILMDGAGEGSIVIGSTRDAAAEAFERMRAELGPLQSLAELSISEISRRTGLSEAQAELAREREYGIVIITPRDVSFERAAAVAAALGHRLILGDRFWHLVGRDADKGHAVRVLLERLDGDVTSVGLGNGPSDAGVLEAVDVAIVVPGPGGPHPALVRPRWRVAPAPGPAGWAAAVTAVLSLPDA